MFITVSNLANCINNKKRIDITNWKVEEINIVLSEKGRKLEYFVSYASGLGERFTEQTVPNSIIELINKYNPVHKAKTESSETFYYRFA